MKTFYKPIQIGDKKAKGKIYHCDNPIYNSCTLYLLPDGRGLATIQQRFNKVLKVTWWGPIDTVINVDISQQANLQDYLMKEARLPVDGMYPTVPLRKMMWALRMKPLPHENWETKFF